MTPQLLTVIKEDVLKTWTPEEWAKWWIEPKYDGARLIYHKGRFLSRTGKPLHNLAHIGEELQHLQGWTLDGEVYGANWAETMSAARASKTVKLDNGLRFAVFDAMSDYEWVNCTSQNGCADRRLMVYRLVCGMENVHVVPHVTGLDYSSFAGIHAMNLKEGCDGTVLKRHDSLYEFKRTKTWLKVKPVETFDCLVCGVEPGEGKHAGRMGALVIKPEGSEVHCNVGTGFSDAERTYMWATRLGGDASIIGKTIEVSARGVHKSGRLIEPRFIRIREDK